MRRREAERPPALLPVALVVTLSSACGGGSTTSTTPNAPDRSAGSSSASSRSGDATRRPEGPWTLAAWTVKRSDSVANPQGRILLGTLTPSCPSGPCDVAFTPAGANGTYREPEAPPGTTGQPATEPIRLLWDGKVYVGREKPRAVGCSPTGKVAENIEKGYTVERTMTMTFVPPLGEAPASVHGTIVSTTRGSAAGKAKGCTDFVETEAFGGSPTGSVDAATPLGGEYDASMSSTGSTPSRLAPVGQPLWLGSMKVAGSNGAQTIRGITTATASLTRAATGWGGTAPAAPFNCQDPTGKPSAKGADATETFSAVRPVAVTKDGQVIFVGFWGLRANPNATGLKAACSLVEYEGRLVLVPHGARG